MSFARFMAGPIGRGARALVGIVLIVVGLASGGTGGWILAIVGVVPLAAGVFNVCLIAPLIKAPFSGKAALSSK
jgi:hypothetical protein